MTGSALSPCSDAELVARFRKAAIERAKCRYLPEGNHIYDRDMTPAYNELDARGKGSLSCLLALVDDPSPDVRLDTAILVYELDPPRCREALRSVLKERWLRPVAFALLLQKDPSFAAEYSQIARQQGHDGVVRMLGEFADGNRTGGDERQSGGA